jgi:uncharacterized Zn finger protein (UPF0148 family)
MYRGKVLCPECYDTRLERKAAKKAELKRKAAEVRIVTPSKKAKKSRRSKRKNLIPDVLSMDDVNEDKAPEDSN